MRGRSAFVVAIVFVTIAVAALTAVPAVAGPNSCTKRTNDTIAKLLECMTLEGVREHQAALQEIADENGGTRAAGTPGYDASVDYVVDTLKAAGWTVSTHEFDFTVAQPIRQLTPAPATTHASGGVIGSTLGTVTAAVTPIDINLVPPRASTSGCDGAFAEAAVGAPLTADPGGPNDF